MIYYEQRKKKLAELIAQTSLAEFSRRTGRSKSQLSDCATGRKKIGERLARTIETEAGLPPGFLDAEESGVGVKPVTGRAVPLIPWGAIGSKDFKTAAKEVLYTDMTDLSPSVFAIDILDDSMSPVFLPGDHVIIDPDISPLPGDFVLAKTPKGRVFRKYRLLNEEDFSLVPLNEDYPTIGNASAVIDGVMIEHRRYRKKR